MDELGKFFGKYFYVILIGLFIFLEREELQTWSLFQVVVVWGLAILIFGMYGIDKKIEKYEELEQKKIEDNYDANGNEKKRKKFLSFRDS